MDGAGKLDGREAAVTVDAVTLDTARFGLHRARPHHSAKRVLYFTQALAIIAIIAGFSWAAAKAPALTFAALHVAAFLFFGCAILWRLAAASNLSPLLWRLADPPRFPRYTILCPLYREANVVPDLVAALARLDYPPEALDVQLLVEADDRDTIAAALAVANAPHIEVVAVPACAPRTKPKALNVGLMRARGEFVVVYDAEDRPHPQQLRAALAAFENGGDALVCVQAPLSIDNAGASWISRQFAAEYAIQFREMLPFLAQLGLPLPLGGTSNHFRTAALRAAGGWDPFNVKEDNAQNAMISRRNFQRDFTHPIRVPFKSEGKQGLERAA